VSKPQSMAFLTALDEVQPTLAAAQLRARLDRLVATAALGGLTLASDGRPVDARREKATSGMDQALHGLQKAIAALPSRLAGSSQGGVGGASTPRQLKEAPDLAARSAEKQSAGQPLRLSTAEAGLQGAMVKLKALAAKPLMPPQDLAGTTPCSSRSEPTATPQRHRVEAAPVNSSPAGECKRGRRWASRRAIQRKPKIERSLEFSPSSLFGESMRRGVSQPAPPSPVSFRSPASACSFAAHWAPLEDPSEDADGSVSFLKVRPELIEKLPLEQATEELLALAATAQRAAAECPACKPLAAALQGVAVRELTALQRLRAQGNGEDDEDWRWLQQPEERLREVRKAAAEGIEAIHLALQMGTEGSAKSSQPGGLDQPGERSFRSPATATTTVSPHSDSAMEAELRTPERYPSRPLRPNSAPVGGSSSILSSPPSIHAWSAGACDERDREKLRQVFGSVVHDVRQTVQRIRSTHRRQRWPQQAPASWGTGHELTAKLFS